MVMPAVDDTGIFLVHCRFYYMEVFSRQGVLDECFIKRSGRTFLSPVDCDVILLSVEKIVLAHCKHHSMVVDGKEKFQEETKSSIGYKRTNSNFLSRTEFLYRIDFHMIMPTVDDTKWSLTLCKYSHMVLKAKYKNRSVTKHSITYRSMELKFLSPVEFFVLH